MSGDAADGQDRDGASDEMTLAFTLDAIEGFADPRTVFVAARVWSRHVGVVGNDTDAVAAFVDAHSLQQDFDVGEADKWLAMERIRESTATPRHVFVGTSVEDRRIADHLGWEYRTPEEVAEKADWELEGAESNERTDIVARLKGIFSGE